VALSPTQAKYIALTKRGKGSTVVEGDDLRVRYYA